MKNKILCFMLAFLTLFNCIVPQFGYVYAADVDNSILVVDGYAFDVTTGTIEAYYEGLGDGSADIIIPTEIENVQVVAIADDAFADCDSLASITVVGDEDSITGAPWGSTAEIIWIDELPSDESVTETETTTATATGVMGTTLSANVLDVDYGISVMSATTEVATFDITVPTSMPITVSADGTVKTSSDFSITNNTNGVIFVDSVQVDTLNSWSIVDFDTDFSKEKVNLKQFGLKINGDEVSTSGAITSANVADWDMAGEDETIGITYDANIAVQGDDISEKIANVTFTLAWDTEPGPDVPITDYYVYTYNNTLQGYLVSLTDDFKTALNNNSTFTDSAGNVWKAGDPLPNIGSTYGDYNVAGVSNMFNGCSTVTKLDLSLWDTSNVLWMHNLFDGCTSLETVDLSSFITSKTTSMSYMFRYCSSLKALDINHFSVTNVTSMDYMFYSCSTLTELDLSTWKTSSLIYMAWMFANCKSLTSLDVSNFYTAKVTSVTYMFYYCSSLTELNISSFDLDSTDSLYHLFWYSNNLTKIYVKNETIKTLLEDYASIVTDTEIIVGY